MAAPTIQDIFGFYQGDPEAVERISDILKERKRPAKKQKAPKQIKPVPLPKQETINEPIYGEPNVYPESFFDSYGNRDRVETGRGGAWTQDRRGIWRWRPYKRNAPPDYENHPHRRIRY